jgi:phage terminase small subunit
MDEKKKTVNKAASRKRMFMLNYLMSYNATAAAKAAGFSEKTAYSQGHRLLKNVEIQKKIAEEEHKIEIKVGISKEKILKELALIGFSDIGEYIIVSKSGNVQTKSLDDLPLGASQAIKKIKEKRVVKPCQGTKDKPSDNVILESTFEFELYDKITALVNMGKDLGMFRNKHEVGLDAATIEAILSVLPTEYAAAVKVKPLEIKYIV